MKKRKNNNIITSITLIFALILMALLPLPVAHAASFSVSKSSVSIENGETSTITINAPTHTGRLDISLSNSEIATISESNLWVENNSKTITITSKSVGTTIITIAGELYDSSTETEEKFSKTVKVTVKKAAASETTNTNGGNNSNITSNGTNNNQSSIVGTNTSVSQGNTSKPSSTITKKPTTNQSSSSTGTSKPSTTVSANTTNEEISKPIIESQEEVKEIENDIENVMEEKSEEVLQEEAVIEQEQVSAEINNMEEGKIIQKGGEKIIIAIIGVIAIMMIFIGIGVSKNILKK